MHELSTAEICFLISLVYQRMFPQEAGQLPPISESSFETLGETLKKLTEEYERRETQENNLTLN